MDVDDRGVVPRFAVPCVGFLSLTHADYEPGHPLVRCWSVADFYGAMAGPGGWGELGLHGAWA